MTIKNELLVIFEIKKNYEYCNRKVEIAEELLLIQIRFMIDERA